MTDNITIRDYEGNPIIVRADDIGSVFWQYLKVAFGTDNAVTVVDAGNPLPVTDAQVDIDAVAGCPIIIDFAHAEIHEGTSFTASHTQDLTSGQVLDFLLVTPAFPPAIHLTWSVDFEFEGHVSIYEAVIATAAANPIVAYNRNRVGTPGATELVITHSPTGITTGTTLIRDVHAGSGKIISGSRSDGREFILKPETKYLLRITNATTSANYISLWLDWYEHP